MGIDIQTRYVLLISKLIQDYQVKMNCIQQFLPDRIVKYVLVICWTNFPFYQYFWSKYIGAKFDVGSYDSKITETNG